MFSIVLVILVAIFVAFALRSPVRNVVAVTAASGGSAVVVGQLCATWLYKSPMSFSDGSVYGILILAVIVMGAVGTAIGFLSHRLIWGGQRAPDLDWSLGRSLGALAATSAILILAGPYLRQGILPSIPLATVDPGVCAVLLVTLVAWLMALSLNGSWVAVALGFLSTCISMIPMSGYTSGAMRGPVILSGAWPITIACMVVLVSSLALQQARLRHQGASAIWRCFWPAFSLAVPSLLAYVLVACLVSGSPSARAAMHPSAKAAFADWAALNWKDADPKKSEYLQGILEARLQSTPSWWQAQSPSLLDDPDPAIRYAAVTAMGWSRVRTAFPSGAQARLMADPERKIRAQTFMISIEIGAPVPSDEDVIEGMSAVFAERRYPSNDSLERWMGWDRMVRVYAQTIMRSQENVSENAAHMVSRDGKLLESVLGIMVADPAPARRARYLELLKRRDGLKP